MTDPDATTIRDQFMLLPPRSPPREAGASIPAPAPPRSGRKKMVSKRVRRKGPPEEDEEEETAAGTAKPSEEEMPPLSRAGKKPVTAAPRKKPSQDTPSSGGGSGMSTSYKRQNVADSPCSTERSPSKGAGIGPTGFSFAEKARTTFEDFMNATEGRGIILTSQPFKDPSASPVFQNPAPAGATVPISEPTASSTILPVPPGATSFIPPTQPIATTPIQTVRSTIVSSVPPIVKLVRSSSTLSGSINLNLRISDSDLVYYGLGSGLIQVD